MSFGIPNMFTLANQLLDAWDTPNVMAKMAKLERAYKHDRSRSFQYERKEGHPLPRAVENEWSVSDINFGQ